MNDIERIKALKETRVKVDNIVKEINELTQINEQKLEQNVDEVCKRIENELEEIYELTDENVYKTRHILVYLENAPKKIKRSYGISFDGKVNKMYFIDTESSYGTKGNDREYHVVISDYGDGSGCHYYEDGKWREETIQGMTWKEYFATYWDDIKKEIIKKITDAYEEHQRENLKDAMNKLNDSENRLAKIQTYL